MTERVLELRVHNIQEMYSKQSILTKSLLVNTTNMTHISPPEVSRSKQTARKTAKSKPFCAVDTELGVNPTCKTNSEVNGGIGEDTDAHTAEPTPDVVTLMQPDDKGTKHAPSTNHSTDTSKVDALLEAQSPNLENHIEQHLPKVKLETPDTIETQNHKTNCDNPIFPDNASNKFPPKPVKSEVKTKKATKQSIEEVIQNLNMKQNLVTNNREPKATLKRCASPVTHGEAKKMKSSETNVLNGITNCVKLNGLKKDPVKSNGVNSTTQTTHRCTCDFEQFKEALKKETLALIEREILYKEEIKLKSEECLKLKEKCETVEKNFKRWIEFANKLQARVKNVAQHNDQLKHALRKDLNRCEMSVQTEGIWPPLSQKENGADPPPSMANEQTCPKPLSETSDNRLPQPDAAFPKTKTNKTNVVPTDVIDLTSDNDITTTKPKNNNISVQEALQRILQTNPQVSTKQPFNNQTKGVATFQPSKRNNVNLGEYNHLRNIHQQPSINPVDGRLRPLNQLPQTLQRQPQSTYTNLHPRSSASLAYIKPKSVLPPPYPPLPEAASASLPSKPIPKNVPSGLPPDLILGIKKSKGVIVLSWRNQDPNATNHAPVACYELFAHQETPGHNKQEWRQIGSESIAAMPLPMACTLTQFTTGCVYYFAVRGKDLYGRYGHFSKPCSSADVKE